MSFFIQTSGSTEQTSAGTHTISMTLLHKTSMYVGSKAVLQLCGLFVNMCQFLSVCICMRVWGLPNEESRKRKRQDGWRGCLFIHYLVALVVSWGGEDMATLVLGPSESVFLWPSLALPLPSALILSAQLVLVPFILFGVFFLFGVHVMDTTGKLPLSWLNSSFSVWF